MTGRGNGKLLHSVPNPSVTIGISLSTLQHTLSASSEEPFYVEVTARILSSPHPERPITLWTHLSPLDGLHTRAFENIRCTSDESKFIEIWPRGWPYYIWDPEDMRSDTSDQFVTIPPHGQGAFSIKHQVPQDLIRDANVKKGEKYRVRLTDKCLGTKWWTFGAVEELEGVRLRWWRSPAEEEAEAAYEREFDLDPEMNGQLESERRQRYGTRLDMPTLMGENHDMLAMVPEIEEVEFEVLNPDDADSVETETVDEVEEGSDQNVSRRYHGAQARL